MYVSKISVQPTINNNRQSQAPQKNVAFGMNVHIAEGFEQNLSKFSKDIAPKEIPSDNLFKSLTSLFKDYEQNSKKYIADATSRILNITGITHYKSGTKIGGNKINIKKFAILNMNLDGKVVSAEIPINLQSSDTYVSSIERGMQNKIQEIITGKEIKTANDNFDNIVVMSSSKEEMQKITSQIEKNVEKAVANDSEEVILRTTGKRKLPEKVKIVVPEAVVAN